MLIQINLNSGDVAENLHFEAKRYLQKVLLSLTFIFFATVPQI